MRFPDGLVCADNRLQRGEYGDGVGGQRWVSNQS